MKEVMDAIADFINRVGFPIAACCAMYYMCYKVLGDMKVTLEALKSSLGDLTDVIHRLSAVTKDAKDGK